MAKLKLLDTDTLSYYARNEPNVRNRVNYYLNDHDVLSISCITYYEVLRGLRLKNATRQIREFEQFAQDNNVVPLDKQALDEAADVYVYLHKQGQLINESDILIAGTAIALNVVLVTNNTAHFSRIPQLKLENWRLP